MIPRTLALVWLFAAPALGIYAGNWKARFGLNPLDWGKTSFMDMPQNNTVATDKGWKKKTGPDGPSGYKTLELFCPTDNMFCILTDPKTGEIAGYQIAFNKKHVIPKFDMASQGYSNWTLTENGQTDEYYAIQVYFMSTETLATEPSLRKVPEDKTTILKDEDVWVTGPYGKLYNISTTADYVTSSKTSPYTEQACIPFMGRHYYYNMTKDLECTGENLFSWFPIYYTKQFVALGLMFFAKNNIPSNLTNYFESPAQAAVQSIVPNGPTCLYDLVPDGLITIHVYFINSQWLLFCVLESLFG